MDFILFFRIYKKRYYVIYYVSHYLPLNFDTISIQPPLYKLIFLSFTPKYFLCLPP